MVIFSREDICRGLIHSTLLALHLAGGIVQRFDTSSIMIYRRGGWNKLDPYSFVFTSIVSFLKKPSVESISLQLPLFNTVLQVLTTCVLSILCILFIILIINLFTFYRLKPHLETQTSTQPLISVLIPARDEEQSIERCVRSLVTQTYERLEILVLDDHSSDATPTIVQGIIDELPIEQKNRLRLLHGAELPAGWGGKNFACHQLSQQASGDYLFFTDADTTHDPKMVSSVLTNMQNHNVSLLTAHPDYELASLGERLIVPLLTFTIMTLLPVALIPRRPEPSLATGNGQLLCFERLAYKAIGGHASVKNRILEDVLLARAVKTAGYRMLYVDAQDLVRCRMYHSFNEVWSGFSKNLFALYSYALPFALIALLLNILLFIAPPLLVTAALLFPLPAAVLLLALASYSLAVLMRLLLTLRFVHTQRGLMLLLCFLHPISIALECLILLNSIRWHYRKKGTVWKGRQYSTSQQ